MIFSEPQQDLGHKVLLALREFFGSRDLGGASMAYSGGLDSSVLLALSPQSVVPYALGDTGSADFENSQGGSRMLEYRTTAISLASVDLEKYVKIVRSIDPGLGRKDIGYEVVLAVLLGSIREEEVLTGQGADEIFYGYSIFRDNPGMDNRLHLEKLYTETLPRERKIAEYFGKKLITPYLSSGIPAIMENAGREVNFSGEHNKAVLRCAAELAGVPREIVERRKKAAQYGSGLMKRLKTMPVWNTL